MKSDSMTLRLMEKEGSFGCDTSALLMNGVVSGEMCSFETARSGRATARGLEDRPYAHPSVRTHQTPPVALLLLHSSWACLTAASWSHPVAPR